VRKREEQWRPLQIMILSEKRLSIRFDFLHEDCISLC
jgi:hypothetical protein